MQINVVGCCILLSYVWGKIYWTESVNKSSVSVKYGEMGQDKMKVFFCQPKYYLYLFWLRFVFHQDNTMNPTILLYTLQLMEAEGCVFFVENVLSAKDGNFVFILWFGTLQFTHKNKLSVCITYEGIVFLQKGLLTLISMCAWTSRKK